MKRSVVSLIAFAIALLAEPALAAMKVFACEPEWAALAEELGGDQVEVYTATTALQNPHRIQARPSLIAKVRSADLLICTGAELEVGWLPILLRQSGNPESSRTRQAIWKRPCWCRAWRCRHCWTGLQAMCIRRVIRTSRPTRAISRA